MTPFHFPSHAHWIWTSDATRPYHNVAGFRQTFHIQGGVSEARLKITADARYEVFVNGEWLGHGPARSWPSPWPVDPYDLRGALRPGKNVIAVRVQHFGIGTFQYLHAQPGLLVQLLWSDERGSHELVSDGTWKAHAEEAYCWPVPRLSCMQAWEEQFDSRTASQGWTGAAFDDSSWPRALATQEAGQGSHPAFSLRDIPQLTREPVSAVRVRRVDAVRPAPHSWSLNPRDFLNPSDKSANHLRGNLFVLTHLYSERAQKVSFHPPHHRPGIAWMLNGTALNFDDHSLQQTDTGVAHARLKAGWNTLIGPLPKQEHYWWAVLNIWTAKPVRWSAYPWDNKAETPWLAIGPFGNPDDPTPPPPTGSHQALVDALTIPAGATLAQFEAIRKQGGLLAEEYCAAYVRPLTRDMVAGVDVYALCASERIVEKERPRVDSLETILHDTSDWAVIHPVKGADVRLLLDFGREVVGYHEFEVDAPAGAIIDNHNFEFIQPDGRMNLAEGMNNSFRYICREGVQRYRTLLRRGFQYSWFSFRRFERPIRVRLIRVIMSTYPQARQGAFACSDAWLDRIWEAGANSVECCSEDTYTDCPSYEQTFWVGDARNEALVDLTVNGDPRLSAHSWNLAAQSLDRSGLVESQVPSAWENILPAWSFLWMRWAQEHHQFTGDDKLARHMVRQLARNIAGIERHLGERGLFKIRAWNMFDWAPLDTPPDGEITHLNALTTLGLRQAASLAKNIGAAKEAKAWNALADKITRAINRHLWDSRKRAYIDCIHADGTRSRVYSQQTHTAISIAGVAAGDRLKRSRQIMEKAPKGFIQAGSPFFMFFLLEGLAREGRFKKLLNTIKEYWGVQVEAGATTFWEMYNPDRPRMTRSHCHGWSAAPTYFLSRHLLGIAPLEPGFAKVRVAPQPSGLKWARGRVPTPRGVISVAWRHERGCFELDVTLPPKVATVIDLPLKGRLKLQEGSVKNQASPQGMTRLATTSSRVRLSIAR